MFEAFLDQSQTPVTLLVLKSYLAQLFDLADLVRHGWWVHLHVDTFCRREETCVWHKTSNLTPTANSNPNFFAKNIILSNTSRLIIQGYKIPCIFKTMEENFVL